MSAIEEEVQQKFFECLSDAEEVNDAIISSLRKMLTGKSLPKAEQLVQLISDASGEALT